MAYHEWFNAQKRNPAAQERVGVPWNACCDNGDVFKARFRVNDDRSDQWQYLLKDGQRKQVPPDVVKEEDTPDHQPVLFVTRHTGEELCFLCRKVDCEQRSRHPAAGYLSVTIAAFTALEEICPGWIRLGLRICSRFAS
jgi:hypothetical protein